MTVVPMQNVLKMDDDQLNRYSRQILLPEIDIDGQAKLLNARVLIIGAGGLGSNVAQTLVSAGVGKLTLCDHDEVELSNLQRQPLFDSSQIGQKKVTAAKHRLSQINTDTAIEIIDDRMTNALIENIIDGYDLVLDCTDNYETRVAINQAAVQSKIPLIAAAAIRFEGQIMTFLNQGDGPCYSCLQAQIPIADVACRDVGVLASNVIMIASIQAQLSLKYLLGVGRLTDGRLLLVDGLADSFQSFHIKRSADCPCCLGDKAN